MKWRVLFHFLTKTIWFQLPRISRLRWLRKSALERLVVSPIAERCALRMDALRARDLAAAVHSAAVDVARGNFDAVASPHHRRRTEESASEGSRRQRIERTKNLWVEVCVSFGLFWSIRWHYLWTRFLARCRPFDTAWLAATPPWRICRCSSDISPSGGWQRHRHCRCNKERWGVSAGRGWTVNRDDEDLSAKVIFNKWSSPATQIQTFTLKVLRNILGRHEDD